MQISVTRRDETPREAFQRRQADAAAGLSFALISGPVTWFIHALILWTLLEMGCFSGLHTMRFANTNLIELVMMGSTVAAALVMIAGLSDALRCLRGVHDPELGCTDPRARLMSLVGVVLNPLFMLVVLFEVSALLLSPICGVVTL